MIEGFALAPPADRHRACIEASWRAGRLLRTLEAGTSYWRVLRAPNAVAAADYARVAFPSSNAARFSPLAHRGSPVASAYAATSPVVALWEVVLRDARHRGLKRIPYADVRGRYAVPVAVRAPLTIAQLLPPQLLSLIPPGERPPDLSAAWPSAYPTTAAWAQCVYDLIPGLDGLEYLSHQAEGRCIVLFDRAARILFDAEGPALPAEGGAIRALLLKQADAAGIAVEFNEPLSNDELE